MDLTYFGREIETLKKEPNRYSRTKNYNIWNNKVHWIGLTTDKIQKRSVNSRDK